MPESAVLTGTAEEAERVRSVMRDLDGLVPLRALPVALDFAWRADPELAWRQEEAGLRVAAAVECGSRGVFTTALDDWLDELEVAMDRYRASVGDPATAPVPVWCWWAGYTPADAEPTVLSRALEAATGLPGDAEAALGSTWAPVDRETLVAVRDALTDAPLPRLLPALVTWSRVHVPELARGEERAAVVLARRMGPGTTRGAVQRAARAWRARLERIREAAPVPPGPPAAADGWTGVYGRPLRVLLEALVRSGLLEGGPSTDAFVADVVAAFGGEVVLEDHSTLETEWEAATPLTPAPEVREGDTPAQRCRTCGRGRWWRLRAGCPWTCERCHPPGSGVTPTEVMDVGRSSVGPEGGSRG